MSEERAKERCRKKDELAAFASALRRAEGRQATKSQKEDVRSQMFASPRPVRPLADTANGTAGMRAT